MLVNENTVVNQVNSRSKQNLPYLPHSAATTTFASVTGNAPVAYIAVTLNNTQTTATPANMQQKIIINPSLNSSFYASDLRNVNWQDGNGNILSSWLENGSSNLSTSAMYWINLGSNTIAGNGGTLKIYQVIYAASVNALNTQTTGAYPTYTTTYGQYDNGQNVFPVYYNFNGSSSNLPSGLTSVEYNSGFWYTINNGLTLTGSSGSNGQNQAIHIFTQTKGSYNIAEMYLASTSSLGTYASWELSLATSAPQSSSSDAGFQTAYRYDWLNGYYRIIADKFGSSVYGASNPATLSTPAIETLLWPATGTEIGQSNGTQQIAGTDNSITYQNSYIDVALVTSNYYVDSIFQINWLRTRIYPPSGIMPSVNLGNLTTTAISNTVAASPVTVDQSQSSSLTSNVRGGFAPYTFQWLQKAPGAGSFSNITGANSVTYNFQTSGGTTVGLWQFALLVIDNNATNYTSPSPASITVNSLLVAPTAFVDHSIIDLNQNATLSATLITTGTPSYTYQWLNSTSPTGPFVIISAATSSTYTFIPWATSTWYFELNVSDSAGVNVTVTSNAVMVAVNTRLIVPTAFANNGTIDLGQSAALWNSTIISTGTSPYTYQWLNSTTGGAGTYVAIPGATGTNYTFTPWVAGKWWFELNVTDSATLNETVTSNAVTVAVNTQLVAPTAFANSSTIDLGQSAALWNSTIISTGTS
ncbi:MAG TPA: hypothetical protein VKK79_04590, partial [Candidatus Lokiarchaeia archaeon]|nr:hypothetical protein [Candidatus Lokiarchaeia archaeon]